MSADTYLCPGCDKEVLVGSRGCPYCHPPAKRRKRSRATARKARKSWEQDPACDGLDLPDGDFDYEDFVAREFGRQPHRRIGIKWYWWLTGVIVIILIVLAGFSLCGWGTNAWK